MADRRKARRARDILLYVLIALLFVAVLLWSFEARWFVPKWFGLVVLTAGLFAHIVEYYRSCWTRRSFWVVLALLLVTHLLLAVALLARTERFWPAVVVVLFPVESCLIGLVLMRLGFRPSRAIRH